MLLGVSIAKNHWSHRGAQGSQQVLPLVGHPAGQTDHFREEDVDHVGNAHRKVMNVLFHHGFACGIALGGGIKGGAAIYPAALDGKAMQGAFGVGCHGFFGHADQGGGTGPGFPGSRGGHRCSAGHPGCPE